LLHPITVGALALLLLNDHLLKAAWPGVVTGKLSDFAGLALAPSVITAVLALLLPRLPVRIVAGTATLIVGIVFGLVKVTVLGAAWASAGWSWAAGPAMVLRDPTDLLALPALAASWWAFAHVRRHPLPGRVGGLAALPRRPRAWWAIPLVTVGFGYVIVLVSRMGVLLGVLSSVPAVLILIAIALVLWLTIMWSTGTLTFTRAALLAALAVIAFAVSRRPIIEWSSGQIDSYEAAVRTATQLVAGSIVAMTLVGLAFRVRDHVRPSEAPIPATGRNAG